MSAETYNAKDEEHFHNNDIIWTLNDDRVEDFVHPIILRAKP